MILTIAVCATAMMGHAQAPALSKRAQAVRDKVEKLSDGAKISVVRLRASELYGTFVSREADGFTMYDIDAKTDVTLKYDEIRRVKDGYGGYNSLVGKHTDRTRALVIGAVIIGGLIALVLAAAMS